MNSNQLPISGGVAIFIAVIISYFVYSPADLSGVRPNDSRAIEQVHGNQDVQARLWQDPFAAVAIHKHSNEKKIQFSGKVIVGPTGEINPMTAEIASRSSKPADQGDSSKAKPHAFGNLVDQIVNESKESKKSVNVLSVMVSAGPYPEDEERRLRRRYAVIAGLAASGYQPENAAHIGYVDDLPAAVCSGNHPDDSLLPAIMPYEWFKNEEEGSYFLLLWLDEDAFSRKPLCKLNSLAHLFKDGELQFKKGELKALKQEELTEIKSIKKMRRKRLISYGEYIGKKTNIRKAFAELRTQLDRDFLETFKIIGPSRSHTLKAMLKEMDEISSDKVDLLVKKAQFFSAMATAKDSELIKHVDRGYDDGLAEKKFMDRNLQLFRTIADDGALSDILVKELRKRTFDLGYKSRVANFQIALVSEWDTLYGRSLPDAFVDQAFQQQREMAKAVDDLEMQEKTKEEWAQKHIYRFSYLRGIDGRITGEARAEKSSEKRAKQDTEKNAVIDRPEGRSQRDYLRRLASDMQLKDQQLKSEGKKGIRAIGILGSDVYDKLMVLRVLRQRFPKAIFFTTDLDASLLHPSEFQWTRNMLIASSFDLKIANHQELNKMQDKLEEGSLRKGTILALMGATKNTIPQFRDLYQTSVYLSTLWATNKEWYASSIMEVKKLYEALKANALKDEAEAKKRALEAVIKKATDAPGEVVSAAKNTADEAVKAVSAAKEVADKAASVAKKVADKAVKAVKEAADKAASVAKNAADEAGKAVKAVKAASVAKTAADEAADKAVKAVRAVKAAKEAADKAALAAKKVADKAGNAAEEVADKAVKAAKNALAKAGEAATVAVGRIARIAEEEATDALNTVNKAAEKAETAALDTKKLYKDKLLDKVVAKKAVKEAKDAANEAAAVVEGIIKGFAAVEAMAKAVREALETTDQDESADAETRNTTKSLARIEKLTKEARETLEAVFGTRGVAVEDKASVGEGRYVEEKAKTLETYRLFLELFKRNISPKVYEVGRNGAVDLSNTPPEIYGPWYPFSLEQFWGNLLVMKNNLVSKESRLSPFYPIKPAAFSLQGVLIVAACLMLFALLAFAFWCRWVVAPDMNDGLYKYELVWARWMTVFGLGILIVLSVLEDLPLGAVVVGVFLGYILVAIRYCYWLRNMMCKKVLVEAAITLDAAVKAVAVAIVAAKEKEEADAKAAVAIKAAANTRAIKSGEIEAARNIAEQARVVAAEKTEAAKKAAKKAIAAAEAKAKIKKKYPRDILKRLQEVVEHYQSEGGIDARI